MMVNNSDSGNVKISFFNEILWAFIGLCITIVGTFVEVFFVIPLYNVNSSSFDLTYLPLGITYQLAGVFLASCMGGKNAGAYAQVAYVILGLFKLPVFYLGGTFEYITNPSFGYILGFIPGAWLCGFLVLPGKRRLELFAISSFLGLIVIHFCGIIYLTAYSLITPLFGNQLADTYLFDGIQLYSINAFPSQLALICVVSILAFLLRLILMY
jgi:biotin transport system substrate-specific component